MRRVAGPLSRWCAPSACASDSASVPHADLFVASNQTSHLGRLSPVTLRRVPPHGLLPHSELPHDQKFFRPLVDLRPVRRRILSLRCPSKTLLSAARSSFQDHLVLDD